MNTERLKKIEEIYHAALEIPVEERESFVAESCGEDGELRREVESLLLFNNDSDALLKTPPEFWQLKCFPAKDGRSLSADRSGITKFKNF